MAKLAALITARDAALILPDLLASIEGHVDAVVVGVDDRTVDETREVALAAGCLVADVSLMRDEVMDFGQGRRQTVDFAKTVLAPDIDFFVWLDTDDVLAGPPDGLTPPAENLHVVLDDALREKPNVESVWLPYIYSRDQEGNIFMEHYRERIIKFSAYAGWQSRLHETCHTTGGPSAIWSEGGGAQHLDRSGARVIVDHRNRKQTEAGKYERNDPILRKMIEEDPNDLRAVREMAEHEFAATHWESAIAWYERFLLAIQNSTGTPLEEKWMAVIYKAKAERMAGRFVDAIRSADRAFLMCPQYADGPLELAYGYYVSNHWSKAIYWLEEAERRDAPVGILQTSPLDYECIPYQILHDAYARVGKYERAILCVQQALKYRQTDELHAAMKAYQNFYSRQGAVEAALHVAKHLADTNEPLKAEVVLANLPVGSREEYPSIQPIQDLVDERLAHMRNPIAYRNFYTASENQVDPVEELEQGNMYPRMLWLLERLKANNVKTVLNVGIGSGFDTLLYAKHGIRAVGIDVDPKRVKDCNMASVRAGHMALVPFPDHSPMATPTHEHIREHAHSDEEPCFVLDDEDEWKQVCRIEICVPETCQRPAHGHGFWTDGCNLCGPVLMLPDMRPDALAQFLVSDGERVSKQVKDLGPYDAVVLAELLEHVRDVDAVLTQAEELAPLVIISTPDGTAPTFPYPSHVRSWSRQELENLGYTRGRLTESHYLADHPDQLGLEYRPNETTTNRKPVTIFCGAGLEPWTPDQVNGQGLGGSETAVVYVAKELVKQGYRVMVYAEAEGVWDGVYYRKHTKFVPGNPVHLFVAWRQPELFDLPLNAEHTALWVHDIDAADRLTEERAKKIGSVWAVSGWHAQHLTDTYPFIVDKVLAVGNGIETGRFLGSEVRDPNRFVYISSPDRGLERALVFWPLIKKAIPEATLHVYYGWQNYDAMGADRAFKNWVLDKAKADGVVWHDRIGQRELASELMKSSALFYPGPHMFKETSCIAVMEAQAAGCIPITRDNGALSETNRHGVLLSNSRATVLDYITALKSATTLTEEDRDPMREWARTRTWDAVVERIVANIAATEARDVARV